MIFRSDFSIAWDPSVSGDVEYAVEVDGEVVALDLTVCEHPLVGVPDGVHTLRVYAYWDGDETGRTLWSTPAELTVEVRTVAPDPPGNLVVV